MTGGARRSLLFFSLLALALVVTGINYAKQETIITTLERITMEDSLQTLTTTWQSDGLAITITTPRNSGETAAAWAARHKEGLDAAKAVFPVDPPAGS